MAFMDKLGQIANKVGDVAGDTLDYSKAKGKAVLERGKIKDEKIDASQIDEIIEKAISISDEEKEKLCSVCQSVKDLMKENLNIE